MDTAARLRTAGMAIGFVVGLVLFASGAAGLAPPAAAAGVWIGLLLGEVSAPRPWRALPASTTLDIRRVRNYVPRSAYQGVVVLAVALAVALGYVAWQGFVLDVVPFDIGSSIKADPSYAAPSWFGPFSEFGPWAGHGLGGLVAALAITYAASVLLGFSSLRAIARSPRAGATGEQLDLDEAWRCRSARAVTGALGVIISSALAFIGLVEYGYGTSLGGTAFGTPAVTALLPGTVAVAGLLCFVWYAAMLMTSGPHATAAAPAQPAPAQRG